MTTIAGRYQLRRPLTGTLHLAVDLQTNQEVFARHVLLPPELDADQRRSAAELVLAAAWEATRPRHPAINRVIGATVHLADDPFAGPWVVSEVIAGSPLSQVVAAGGPLDPHRVAALALDLAGALEAAHALAVPHRDIHPGNVWVTSAGRGVLTGYGAALPATLGGTSCVGTPGFTAPEGPDRPGPAADLFSLAATLYLAVEGVPAFTGSDPVAVVSAVLAGTPRAPERAGDLGPVLLARLAKDPADRPTTLVDDLQPLAATPRPARRRVSLSPAPTLAAATGLTVLASSLAIIATYTLVPGDPHETAAPARVSAGTGSTPGASAGTAGAVASALPRACDLLTYAQSDQLIPSSTRNGGSDTTTSTGDHSRLTRSECNISSSDLKEDRTIKIMAAVIPAGAFGDGPETARQYVIGSKESVQDMASSSVSDVPTSSFQDLPGTGDQAFAYDRVIGKTVSGVAVLSVRDIAVTITCREYSAAQPARAHACATRAAGWVAASLKKAK